VCLNHCLQSSTVQCLHQYYDIIDFCIKICLTFTLSQPLWHVGVLTYGTNISHINGNGILVLMHSGIVNGYQLICDGHTMLESHRGTAAFFYFTLYRPFPLFLFMCLSHWQSLFLFLGASLLCVNNLKRTVNLILWFPDRTSVCTHPWGGHLYNFIVLKASLNLTKLN